MERAGSRGLPPLPAVSPESFCWQLASSSPFHLWPLEIIGDALSVNMFLFFIYYFFFRSKLCSIVSGRGPETSASVQRGGKKKVFLFNILKVDQSFIFCCFLHSYATPSPCNLLSRLLSPVSLFPPPSLLPAIPPRPPPPPLSVCALITSPNWQ